MKNRKLGRFWSLRPRLAAEHLEVASAAVAVALLITLLAQPATPERAAQASAVAVSGSRPFIESPLGAAARVPHACIECFGGVGTAIARPAAAVPICLTRAGRQTAHGRRLCLLD